MIRNTHQLHSEGILSAYRDNAAVLAGSRGGSIELHNHPGIRSTVALAAFSQQPIESLGGITLDEYYDKVVSSIAQSSASEGALAEGAQTFRDSLKNQREQFSGVSIDEETINVMKFQRAFQSAARLVSTIDELFTILLQI